MGDSASIARPVAASVAELLVDATWRAPMDKHVDSLSGSAFERARIDGTMYVLKHIGYDIDWLARALDDRDCWAVTLWRTGLLDRLPDCLDHTVAGAAYDEATGIATLLLRDVGEQLVPPGSEPLPLALHTSFLDHMARMHVAFWGFEDAYGLLPLRSRYIALTPATGERERLAGHDDPVPRALAGGWAELRAAAPEAHDLALALATDPAPLVAALEETPATFIHGDWKAGNLGAHPDGRTILLDWGWPGRAGPLVDVAWYLAVNCDRLPVSKTDAVATYRSRLEAYGVETSGWWDRQLDLALLGAFLQLGWSKTGDSAELAWWVDRVAPVARELLA